VNALPPDHRRHPRFTIRQRVWCESERVTLYVQALNVSAGGLFVRTASPPTPGERFRMSFTDMDGAEVVATVEVVWRREDAGDHTPGMGVRIVSVESGHAAFERFVARHSGREARGDD